MKAHSHMKALGKSMWKKISSSGTTLLLGREVLVSKALGRLRR